MSPEPTIEDLLGLWTHWPATRTTYEVYRYMGGPDCVYLRDGKWHPWRMANRGAYGADIQGYETAEEAKAALLKWIEDAP